MKLTGPVDPIEKTFKHEKKKKKTRKKYSTCKKYYV